MSVCDPHRKAYVNHSGTVGDTQHITNDLQRYYVCIGSLEPFMISSYRTRELGVNCAHCKIIRVVIFSGNVWDPKRKAHITLVATDGDTQQITNGLQHLYVCEGAPELFVIEPNRGR